jgi:hypothetical protein
MATHQAERPSLFSTTLRLGARCTHCTDHSLRLCTELFHLSEQFLKQCGGLTQTVIKSGSKLAFAPGVSRMVCGVGKRGPGCGESSPPLPIENGGVGLLQVPLAKWTEG